MTRRVTHEGGAHRTATPWASRMDATHRCPGPPQHYYRCARGGRCESEEEVLACDAHAEGGHRRARQELEPVPPPPHWHRCYSHGLYRCFDRDCLPRIRTSITCAACAEADTAARRAMCPHPYREEARTEANG